MFDIGMSELLLIGIVALIVVGPKDLPGLFHTLGRMTARARALGREFSRAMNDAAKESGVGDVANDLKGIASPKKFGLDKLNDAADRFENWDPKTAASKSGTKPLPDPNAPATDPERAADMAKIRAATEKAGRAKLEREAAAAEAEAETTPAPKPAKKPAAKRTTAKKPAAKSTTAKSATAKSPASKRATPKNAAAKKPAAKTSAATSAKPARTAKAPAKPKAATPTKAASK